MSCVTPINYICHGLVSDSKGLGVDVKTYWTITRALGDVERCVTRYSHVDGKKNHGLLYRIWNAIKALFGQSDWQKARKALKIAGREIAQLVNRFSENEANNWDEEGRDSKLVMNIDLPVEWSSKDCDKFLRGFVKLNENHVIKKLVPLFKKSCIHETPTIFAPILFRDEFKGFIQASNEHIRKSGTISSEELSTNIEFSFQWIKEMSSTAIGKRLIQILDPSLLKES